MRGGDGTFRLPRACPGPALVRLTVELRVLGLRLAGLDAGKEWGRTSVRLGTGGVLPWCTVRGILLAVAYGRCDRQHRECRARRVKKCRIAATWEVRRRIARRAGVSEERG